MKGIGVNNGQTARKVGHWRKRVANKRREIKVKTDWRVMSEGEEEKKKEEIKNKNSRRVGAINEGKKKERKKRRILQRNQGTSSYFYVRDIREER